MDTYTESFNNTYPLLDGYIEIKDSECYETFYKTWKTELNIPEVLFMNSTDYTGTLYLCALNLYFNSNPLSSSDKDKLIKAQFFSKERDPVYAVMPNINDVLDCWEIVRKKIKACANSLTIRHQYITNIWLTDIKEIYKIKETSRLHTGDKFKKTARYIEIMGSMGSTPSNLHEKKIIDSYVDLVQQKQRCYKNLCELEYQANTMMLEYELETEVESEYRSYCEDKKLEIVISMRKALQVKGIKIKVSPSKGNTIILSKSSCHV